MRILQGVQEQFSLFDINYLGGWTQVNKELYGKGTIRESILTVGGAKLFEIRVGSAFRSREFQCKKEPSGKIDIIPVK